MTSLRQSFLPFVFGITALLLAWAAMQSGDRARSAEIERLARIDIEKVSHGIQQRLFDLGAVLADLPLPLEAAAQARFRALDLAPLEITLWHYDGRRLASVPDDAVQDTIVLRQLDKVGAPAVVAPLTNRNGIDHVLLTVPRDRGWVAVMLPASRVLPEIDSKTIALDSLELGWIDSGSGVPGTGIFRPALRSEPRRNAIDFPVVSGNWRLAYDSLAPARSAETRWALLALAFLLSYGAGLVVYRLSIRPRALEKSLGRLDARFKNLNETLRETLANREQAEAKIHHLTVTDFESGLPNRQSICDHLDKLLTGMRSAPDSRAVTAIAVGLREVENAEQTLGHSIVASVLPEIAQRLGKHLGDRVQVARINTYMLAIILPRCAEDEALERIAELAGSDVIGNYEHQYGRLNVAPRFGIATAEDGYTYAERLLDNAASALSDAEAANLRWSVFAAENRDDRITMIQLESDFKDAIANNEFRMYYQPIVHTDTGKPRGFECLVRWQHPVEGLLAPNRFIDLAESTGLITDLTLWEIREIVRHASVWKNLTSMGCYLSVNLSTLDLHYENLVEEILEMVQDKDLDPSMFRLEITESTLIDNVGKSRETLAKLREAGFGIMMDDFGTGFSSLSYLRQLPFSAVKIDRAFTQAITYDSKDYELVRNIINLVHALEMETIIEGIETSEQHEMLMALSPTYLQGYLFSKPMPAIDAEEYLAAASIAEPAKATGR